MENNFSEKKSSKILQDRNSNREVIDNSEFLNFPKEMKSPKKSNGSTSPRGKVESPKDQNLLNGSPKKSPNLNGSPKKSPNLNGSPKKSPILNGSVSKISDNNEELDVKVRKCRKMSDSSTPSPKKMKTSPEKSPPISKVSNFLFLNL